MRLNLNSIYFKVLIFLALIATVIVLWQQSLNSVRPFIEAENNYVFLQPDLIRKQLNQILSQQPASDEKQVTLVHFGTPIVYVTL